MESSNAYNLIRFVYMVANWSEWVILSVKVRVFYIG